MLDPLTSLSLASSIIQILDLAGTLLERAHRIRRSQDGSVAELQALESSVTRLLSLGASVDIPTPQEELNLSKDQQQAFKLAESCKALAHSITATLEGLKLGEQQGKMKSLMLAMKMERHKSKFTTFEKQLDQKQTEVRDFILMALSESQNFV